LGNGINSPSFGRGGRRSDGRGSVGKQKLDLITLPSREGKFAIFDSKFGRGQKDLKTTSKF